LAEVNPLLAAWTSPEQSPDFPAFHADHFLPAIDIAIEESRSEIAAITSNPAPADFDNTILALERSGATLARVRRIFWLLASAQVTTEISGIEADVSAKLGSYGTEISLDAALFARIRTVWEQRGTLGPEQARLVDRSYKGFVSGGAGLADDAKQRLANIDARLSALSVAFGQNVLAATSACEIVLGREQIEGIPQDLVEAAAGRATEKQLRDRYVFVLDRGVFEGLLTFAEDRSVREATWRAFTGRCQSGPHDNLPLITETVQLRQERAALLGYATYADYALEESMAKTPAAAEALMTRVWGPGLKQAHREQTALETLAQSLNPGGDRGSSGVEPWDWRYLADRVRRERYAYDAAAVRRHLSLDKVRSSAFSAAGRLYGLRFKRRDDIPVYHPDVLAWSVSDQHGGPVGVLFTDYIARPEKHGGAWMGSLRVQEKLDGPVRPIVYTVANFSSPAGESAALLSLDEARTLFHEFGHALHALLSDVTYPSLAGTAVARDFVEFPSKLMEHWVIAPQALSAFGVPEELVAAVGKADSFGQGFATVEFLASALVDLELHRTTPAPRDIVAFEASTLAALGTPPSIGMRHKLAYFTHVFSGGYASAYYSYLWSEVLDADAFEAFEAAGIFDAGIAGRFRREVLAPGDSRDPAQSFLAFRGREPDESALLRSRCLA
jgi:peptidyl-dipeptidase Dcp